MKFNQKIKRKNEMNKRKGGQKYMKKFTQTQRHRTFEAEKRTTLYSIRILSAQI